MINEVLHTIDTWKIQEAQRIQISTAVEREWWPSEEKFILPDQIHKAIAKGKLVIVPSEGENYRLISILNGQGHGEPNTLRPGTLRFMEAVLDLWKTQTGKEADGVKLAVTSLYRGIDLQSDLQSRKEGYNSLTPGESSHHAGASFDISCRSYYATTIEGQLKGVQAWNPNSGLFEPMVIKPLQQILERLTIEGDCNFVVEYAVDNTNSIVPTVFHVCVNPAVESNFSS